MPSVNVLHDLNDCGRIEVHCTYGTGDYSSQFVFTIGDFVQDPSLFDQAIQSMAVRSGGRFRIVIQPRSAGFARFTTGNLQLDDAAGDKLTMIEAVCDYNITKLHRLQTAAATHMLRFDDVELTVHCLRDGIPFTETLSVARLSITGSGSVIVQYVQTQ